MEKSQPVRPVNSYPYSLLQLSSLVILRLLIGWHFLYEGFAKVFNQNWSAAPFLLESKGLFSPFFVSMAQNPQILAMVNLSNKLGLIAIGLGLMTGTLTRLASLFGILLIMLYYFATPPFIGYTYSVPVEGSYMIVNKNLIEAWALLVLIVFPTGKMIGLDRLLFPKKSI
ncbi:DoxX family protein [bacterium]|nr:DoxX family protein [bacterium]